MTQNPRKPPEYSEKTIIGIINDCNDIQDLSDLCNTLRDLERNKDLIITEKIKREVKVQQMVIVFGGKLNRKNKN